MLASKSQLPVNTWLQRAVGLAAHSLALRIDREQGNRPFFWFNLETEPPSLQHDYWDFCDMSGRWVDAFILARLMTGLQIGDSEQCMKDYMLSHQRDDGLFYNEPCHTAAVIKIGNIPPGAFADMLCQSASSLAVKASGVKALSSASEMASEQASCNIASIAAAAEELSSQIQNVASLLLNV